VYIIILPAFGLISEIIPTFARKKLFGYRFMVYAIIAIAVLSFIVWVHHMFVTGVPLAAELFFMYSTMLIAVPTGIKVFNWVTTLYRGAISFETPMLFALAFVILFTIGGFSGIRWFQRIFNIKILILWWRIFTMYWSQELYLQRLPVLIIGYLK
jgi:cytochrome c oxidase subunit I